MGLIDSSQARRYDRRWQWLCRLAIEKVGVLQQEKVMDRLFQLKSIRGLSPHRDANSARDYEFQQKNDLLELLQIWQPWAGWKPAWNNSHDNLVSEYTKAFGDPNDPEYKAEIERTIAEMRQAAFETESDDERTSRLMNERELARIPR